MRLQCSAHSRSAPRRPSPLLRHPLLLPTISGVLYFLSWIGFGIWPLAFVCFLPLLWSLREATPKQAFLRGWWMGFVTHLGGYTWIMHLLSVFAGAPPWVAFLGYLLLCIAQGLLFAAMSLALVWLRQRTKWSYVALLPISLAACEFSTPLLFQSYTGVALMPVLPLVQIAELGGPILLSVLQTVVNGALFDTAVAYQDRASTAARALAGRHAAARSMSASLIAVLASGAFGFSRIVRVEAQQASAPHLRVGLAQPNVGELALHKNPDASVRTLRDETAEISARGAALAVWPEVGFNTQAVPVNATDGKPIQGNVPIAIIAGVERVSSHELWNSAIAIDENGRIGDHYDKMQLLAFGEYIPGGEWFPKIYDWLPVGHLGRGKTTRPLKLLGYRFATFICYEDILPGDRQRHHARPGRRPRPRDGQPHQRLLVRRGARAGRAPHARRRAQHRASPLAPARHLHRHQRLRRRHRPGGAAHRPGPARRGRPRRRHAARPDRLRAPGHVARLGRPRLLRLGLDLPAHEALIRMRLRAVPSGCPLACRTPRVGCVNAG
jgi:apolipoprotein N-acyltransferase